MARSLLSYDPMKTTVIIPLALLFVACGAEGELAQDSDPAIQRGASKRSGDRQLGTTAPQQQMNTTSPDTPLPEAIVLSDVLYIRSVPQQYYDRDKDFLNDSREEELAAMAAPFLQFSRWENVGTPDTLFQVHPIGCTGPQCSSHQVEIRYGFIWQSDGGYYGSKSGGCDNSKWHGGDVLGVSVRLRSSDGLTWIISGVGSWIMRFPDIGASFAAGLDGKNTHLRLFVSAGKHHPFFDTSFNDEDSPYSDWWCNDLIDDGGTLHVPELQHHNVGEKEHHSPTVAGYEPWNTARYRQTNPLSDFWRHDAPAPYAGQLALEETGIIHGRIDTWQTPPDLVVYFREANAHAKPWSRLQLDGPRFTIQLPAGEVGKQYLFRPVASDWDFENAPRGVFSVPNNEVSFTMTGYPRNLGPLPTVITAGHASNAVNLAALKYMGLNALWPDVHLRMSEQSNGSYQSGLHPDTRLPRQSRFGFRLYTLLDANGQPASSMDDANCASGSTANVVLCGLGEPVPDAQLKFEIVAAEDFLRPNSSDAQRIKTTNRQGDATTNVQTGDHPGRMRLRVTVMNNPANPWLRPVLTYDVTVQPNLYGDTGQERLGPRFFDSVRVATGTSNRVIVSGN